MQKIIEKDGVVVINGDLTFATTPVLAKQGNGLIEKSSSSVQFDLSAVAKSDNSALALLLNWIRVAQKINKTPRFLNIPQQLEDLIELGGLSEIIDRYK